MKNLTSISLLFLFCQNLLATQLPSDFSAVYFLEKSGATIAKMTLTLRRTDKHIIYESHTRAKGMLALFSDEQVDEISQLQWNEKLEHAYLQNYQFTRKNKTKKNQQFSLQWNTQNNIDINGVYAGKTFALTGTDILWDRLSVQLALAADLKSNNKIQKKYRYNIIDKGKLTEYQFEYISDEVMRINNTQYNTLKIKRPNSSGTRITYFWLAKELDFLPIKVDQYKKGELHLSMSLENFTPKKLTTEKSTANKLTTKQN